MKQKELMSSKGQSRKGMAKNPYTVQEFETLLEQGNWNGGYVESIGATKVVKTANVVSTSAYGGYDSDRSIYGDNKKKFRYHISNVLTDSTSQMLQLKFYVFTHKNIKSTHAYVEIKVDDDTNRIDIENKINLSTQGRKYDFYGVSDVIDYSKLYGLVDITGHIRIESIYDGVDTYDRNFVSELRIKEDVKDVVEE